MTEDLDVFLADFGVPCSAGGHNFTGVLDTPGELMSMGGGSVLSTQYSLRVKSSDAQAAALAINVAITVSGQAFKVREVVPEDDGAFSNVTLSK